MLGQKGLPARSGGIERHVSLLASGLAARGQHVVVYGRRWYAGDAPRYEGDLEQRFTAGIHTKHLDAITHGITAVFDARQLHPDVIHVHGAGTALLLPLVRILHPRAKIITTFHCIDWEHAKWGRVARLAFRLGEWCMGRFSDRVITVSQALTRYCLREYSVQTEYIAHPFRVAPVPENAEELLQNFKLVPERYLLSVSRLVAHKQPYLLIEAYHEASKRFPALFRDLPLVIVGDGSWTDGYVNTLKRLAQATSGVRLLGEQVGATLSALQSQALAHVFPSRSEGLSFAALEAGGYARMAVMSDIPANREASGGHAMFVPLDDREALVQALIQVSSMPANERQYHANHFATHVKIQHSFAERIDEIVRVYRELLDGNGVLTSVVPLAQYLLRP